MSGSHSERDKKMRFMVIVKATADSEAGVMPSEEMISEMTAFNEELVKSGVMLAGEGLHPSSKGARVYFDGDQRTVVDGPFAETKELIAGFWLLEVKSLEEAVEWVKRVPNPTGEQSQIEIRQVFSPEDFEMSDELKDREAALAEQIKAQQAAK
ncbi:YciI family protein [Saccharothrix mutabilis subsp. mutabilis]|uniref:YciI family protein n=2 Tax=Saccharothrix mutabilis TaxID=33921 RepID=A0ABN0TDB9_9PSEU